MRFCQSNVLTRFCGMVMNGLKIIILSFTNYIRLIFNRLCRSNTPGQVGHSKKGSGWTNPGLADTLKTADPVGFVHHAEWVILEISA